MRVPFSNKDSIILNSLNVSHTIEFMNVIEDSALNDGTDLFGPFVKCCDNFFIRGKLEFSSLIGSGKLKNVFYKLSLLEALMAGETTVYPSFIYSGAAFLMYDIVNSTNYENDNFVPSQDSLVAYSLAANDEPLYVLFDITKLIQNMINNGKDTFYFQIRFLPKSGETCIRLRKYKANDFKVFFGELDNHEFTFYNSLIEKTELDCGTTCVDLRENNLLYLMPMLSINNSLTPFKVTAAYNYKNDKNLMLPNKWMFNFEYHFTIYEDSYIILYNYLGEKKYYYKIDVEKLIDEYGIHLKRYDKIFDEDKRNHTYFCFSDMSYICYYGSSNVSIDFYNYNGVYQQIYIVQKNSNDYYGIISRIFYPSNEHLVFNYNDEKTLLINIKNSSDEIVLRFAKSTINYVLECPKALQKTIIYYSNNNNQIVISKISISSLDRTSDVLINSQIRKIVDLEYDGILLKSLTDNLTLKKYSFDYINSNELNKIKEFIKTPSVELMINQKSFVFEDDKTINKVEYSTGDFRKIYIDNGETIFTTYNKDYYDINNVYLKNDYNYTMRKTPLRFLYESYNEKLFHNFISYSQFSDENDIVLINYSSENYDDELNQWIEGIKVDCEIVDDDYLSDILGSKALKLKTKEMYLNEKKTFTDKLYKLIDTTQMNKKGTYVLELWCKNGENISGSLIVTINFQLRNSNYSPASKYNFNISCETYKPILIPLDLDKDDEIISFSIDYVGESVIYLKNIRLIRIIDHSLNEMFYNHHSISDTDGNLLNVFNEFQLETNIYEEGILKEKYDFFSDSSYIYSYDNNKNIKSIKTINSFGQIKEDNIDIINFNLVKNVNKLEENIQYNYDEFNQESEKINYNSNTQTKEYNELGQIVKELVIINDIKEEYEYTYNELNLLNTITINQTKMYAFEYDSYNRVIKVIDINLLTGEEKILNEYGYFKEGTYGKTTQELIGIENSYDYVETNYSFGNNEKLYEISNNLLEKVKINNRVSEVYSYDNFDNVKEITYTNSPNEYVKRIEQEFSYDLISDEQLITEYRNRNNELVISNKYNDFKNIENKRYNLKYSDDILEYQYTCLNESFKDTLLGFLYNYMYYDNLKSDYFIGNLSQFIYGKSAKIDNVLREYQEDLNHSSLLLGSNSILSYYLNDINYYINKEVYYGIQLKERKNIESLTEQSYKVLFKVNETQGSKSPIISILGNDKALSISYNNGHLLIEEVFINDEDSNNEISSNITISKGKWYLLQFSLKTYEKFKHFFGTTKYVDLDLAIDCLEDDISDRTEYNVFKLLIELDPSYVVYGNYRLNDLTDEEIAAANENNNTTDYSINIAFATMGRYYSSYDNCKQLTDKLKVIYQDNSRRLFSSYILNKVNIVTDDNGIETETKSELLKYKKTFISYGQVDNVSINIDDNLIINKYKYLSSDKLIVLPNLVEKYDNTKVYYGYNKSNNITNIVNLNINNQQLDSYRYEYDGSNRIVEDIYDDSIYNSSFNIKYSYDSNGNIFTKDILSKGEKYTYEYDTTNPFLLRKIKLTKNNSESVFTELSYDSNNPLIINQIIRNNETININYQNGFITTIGSTSFEYNHLGQRIVKYDNENVTYYYYDDNNNLISSCKNNINTFYIYDDNNQLLGLKLNNEIYLYDRDILGNITGIIDKTGKLMIKFTYTAFGEPIINIPSTLSDDECIIVDQIVTNNIFLYKGYVYDIETGYFWLSSRYYSPELCRFISPDDVDYLDPESVNGLNLYCYCLNNPIMYADPSGHFVLSSFFIAVGIGAAAAFLSQYIPDVITNIKDGGFQFSDLLTINESNWNDYLGAIIAGAIGGAAGGLGLNLFGTMLLSGFGQFIGDLIGGEIDSFGDAANTFLKAAFTAGLSYGITSAVSAGFGKLQMNSKILSGSSKKIKINARIKNLTGSYGKALNGMKIGRNSTGQFLKQLSFTNSNMALTESTGGVISILLALGGF